MSKFNISDGGYSRGGGGKPSRNAIIAIVIVGCVAFTIGILIGHFAIDKDEVC